MLAQGPARRHGSVALAAALFFAALARVPSPLAASDYAEGLAAYDAGDFVTAAEIWEDLAEAGDAAAQSALAELYLGGFGVAPDPAAAARWYRAAALQGDVAAQLNLGDLYRRGIGVERDPVQAYLWYSLAAEQGNAWAADQRQALEEGLTAEQRAVAEELLAQHQGGN